ncbi:MAG: hypothetical protein QOE71_2717, partial [Pseudonocardiales bacterium]|nr:hypothetical protein [Pseudonocardiales bacterium]
SMLLGLHVPAAFIAMQILFCIGAAAAAMKLRRMMPSAAPNYVSARLAKV